MKIEFSRHIFAKYWNIKFHENPCIGSRVFPYGQTEGRTDMTKLTVFFSRCCERSWKLLPGFKPRLLCHHINIPLYPLNTRLGESQSRYECKREANVLSLSVIEYWYFVTLMKYLSRSQKFPKKYRRDLKILDARWVMWNEAYVGAHKC